MKKYLVLTVLSVLTAARAFASNPLPLPRDFTCNEVYETESGLQSMEFNFSSYEKCPRCSPNSEEKYYATVSLPIGPRGTMVTQAYYETNVQHFRVTHVTMKKAGAPQGFGNLNPSAFPEEILVIKEIFAPVGLNFGNDFVSFQNCKGV